MQLVHQAQLPRNLGGPGYQFGGPGHVGFGTELEAERIGKGMLPITVMPKAPRVLLVLSTASVSVVAPATKPPNRSISF